MVQPKKPLTSAPPPLQSIIFICFTFLLFIIYLYTSSCFDTIDDVATLDTFSTSLVLFKNEEREAIKLGWVRIGIGCFIWSVSLYNCFVWEGWVQLTGYLPNSKLTAEPLRMKGIQTLAPFTTWSWNILGSSFLLNGLLSLYVGYNYQIPPNILTYLLRFALLLFETATPCTILVSSVITYAIWPRVLKNNPDATNDLKAIPMLVQHTLNVFVAFVEVGFLGGLPVRFCDFAVAPLFGLMYVIFTWSMMNKWNVVDDIPKKGGGGKKKCSSPQFLYFFLDTTLEKGTTYCLIILLGMLLVAYGLFGMADVIFGWVVELLVEGCGGVVGQGDWEEIMVRASMVLGVSSIFCKFRD